MSISPENLEAIKRFEAEGGLFTMASGRFPSTFSDIKGLVLNTYAVVLNGNAIYDLENNKLIWSNPLPFETAEKVIRFTEREHSHDTSGLHINALTKGTAFYPNEGQRADEIIDKIKSDPYRSPVYKLIITQSPEISVELRESYEKAFPELMFTQSWNAGLEMNTASGGKGNAVKKLRELLGGREVIHTVVCVGDYENDISMIKYADIGYAVENAADAVKAAADRITVHNNQHAIAHIIEDLAKL